MPLGIIVGVLVVVVLILGILQTRWGATEAVQFITNRLNLLPGATLQVEAAGGSFLRSLSLYDVAVIEDETGTILFEADTVQAAYRLLPLLQRKVDIRNAYIATPKIRMMQDPDSTWDLLSVLPADTAAVDTTVKWIIAIEDAEIRDGAATLTFHNPAVDSTYRLNNLQVAATDVLVGDAFRARLDTLGLHLRVPQSADTVRLGLQATLAENLFSLGSLRLSSAQSMVTGQGTLRLPTDTTGTIDDVDFTLNVDTLAFEDIRLFAPSLDPGTTVSAQINVTGSARLLQAEASALFSDGGSLDLTAEATPTTTGDLTYQLDGSLDRLNPSLFAFENPNLDGRVSAQLDVDLTGTDIQALNGTTVIRLTEAQLGDYTLAPTNLEGTFSDGEVRLDTQTGLRGATFDVTGTVRPFAETPPYDLTLSWANLDLEPFLQDTTQRSNLNGRVRLTGEGFDPQALNATARLNLAPSTYNNASLPSGRITATYTNESATVDADIALAGGQLIAQGTASLGETLRYQITDGRLTDVRFTELIADTTASRLNATFTLQGQGSTPEALNATAAFDVTDSRYGPYVISDATISARLQNRRLNLTTNADLRGGTVNLQATAFPFADPIRFSVSEATFRNLDIGRLQDPNLSTSDLNGRLRLEGQGNTPQNLSISAELELEASQYNQQAITAATATATLRNQQTDIALQIDLPEGQAVLQGTATPFAERPSYALTEGSFENLNLGALLGQENLQSNLSGSITASGQGFTPEDLALEAALDLTPSSLNGEAIREGGIRTTIRDGLTDATTFLTFDNSDLRLQVAGDFFEPVPTYTLDGYLENVRLAELVGIDTLDTRLSFELALEGQGLDLGTLDAAGTLVADSSRVLDIDVNTLRMGFSLREGIAQIDSLALRSNVVDLRGQGAVALLDTVGTRRSDFVFDATVKDLAPIQPFTNTETLRLQQGDFEARVFGPTNQLRFETTLDLQSLAFNDIRVAGMQGRLIGELGADRTVQEAELRASMDFFSLPSLLAEETRFDLVYDGTVASVAGEMNVDSRRSASFEATVDPTTQEVVLQGLNINLDDDRWSLLQDATVTYGDAYNIRNFLLFTDDQQIAIDGIIDPNGDQNLLFTIEQFHIDSIADLLGFDGLQGTLNGALSMEGIARDPTINGALVLDLRSRNRRVGDLNIAVSYDDLQLGLDARLQHVNDNELTLQGYIPVDLRIRADSAGLGVEVEDERLVQSGDLNFTIQAEAFDIGWVGPFLDPLVIDRIRGKLTTDIQIEGTPDNPTFSGFARLTDGVLRYPILDVTHESIAAEVSFADNQLQLQNLALSTGNGNVRGNGTIDFTDLTLGAFDITANATNFLAIDNNEYRAVASGSVTLAGTTTSPELSGDLTVPSMDVYLTATEELDEVVLTEQDIQTLESRFGIRVSEDDTTTFSFYDALTITNLAVELERDSWVRSKQSPRMDVQFTGNLDLRKQPFQDPEGFGTIEVLTERSRIQQFNRTFKLRSGTLAFNGPVTDPVLDFQAAYEVPSRGNNESEVTILLSLEGNLENLDITFASENPSGLPETDIISYIATGRPASQALQFGSSNLENIALSQLSSIVEGVASAGLGLDVIEIQYEENRITVTAGTYLSPELYAAVSQPISRNTTNTDDDLNRTQFTLEYELIPSLLFRLVSQGSNATVNFIWEYAY